MTKKKKIKRSWKYKYKLVKENIGEGGNAVVHKISYDGDYLVVKELKNSCFNDEKKGRFLDEIKIMIKNSDLNSIMPIIDYSTDEFWYVMPFAKPIFSEFKNKDYKKNQKMIFSIASALHDIHCRDLAHRDIKPDNIYLLNDKVCFGDFGLADFSEKHNEFTKSDKGLGAVFTIAPEMKRNPKKADGKKADIYSLAKTIWILLTGESKGFDGQYLITGDYTLRNYDNLKKNHLVELEELLYQATSFNPDDRPSIDLFCSELKRWRDISEHFEKYQISEWNFINKCIFGEVVPDTAIWSDIESIIRVLNVVSSLPVLNHMLFSDKGGLDFKKATKANEKDCIEIIVETDDIFILKPKKLYFEKYHDTSWNYFLLEIGKLAPVIGKGNLYGQQEVLVEDFSGHYVSARDAQYGVYDYDSGEKLPNGFRKVFRCMEGSFLFVMKNGFYNSIGETYDGRHGNCHPIEFRRCIEKLCELTEICKKNGLSFENTKSFLNYTPYVKLVFEEYIKNNINNNKDDIGQQIIKHNDVIGDNFIKEHLMNWSFSDITNGVKIANSNDFKAIYYIEYHDNTISFGGNDKDERTRPLYLCSDGIFKQDKENVILFFDSLESVYCALSKCKQIILNECRKVGVEEGDFFYPQIRLLKGKINPEHLFTEEEIKDLMKKADARVRNQLVVDEDGYARIISGYNDNYVFPVRIEAWEAGNVYVGKYSDLSDSKTAYMCALNGWLLYLKTGNPQYVDFSYEDNESRLLEEIKKYY